MADEKTNGHWEIDVSHWTLGELEDWVEGNRGGAGAIEALRRVAAASIKKSPYAFDPKNPENFRKLSISEWREVLAQLDKAASAEFQKPTG
jgi:hypothetical protein